MKLNDIIHCFPVPEMAAISPTFGIPPSKPYTTFDGHSPIGSLAAWKGDLLFPVINIGFFIIGVVIVVKILISAVGLIKAKFLSGDVDFVMERKGRSIDEYRERNEEIDSLTATVFAALSNEQCLQRMSCEMESYIKELIEARLLTNMKKSISKN